MSKVIETRYEGRYRSAIQTPLNTEAIAVNAAKFSPIDVLAGAYGSCLLGTVDYEAKKKAFETPISNSEIEYHLTEDGTRIGQINVKLIFEGNFSSSQKEVIEFAAKNNCHIGNSLDPAILKNYEFVYNKIL